MLEVYVDSRLQWLVVMLGMKQSGAPLGDVVLPPWAKGDAREFIRAHREVCHITTTVCLYDYLPQ